MRGENARRAVWGVVYAAGYGRRFGGYKQFERIGDERLVDRCVRTLRAVCDGVVVVVPSGFTWDGPPVERAVPGGETNPDSVRAGVDAVPADAEIILLHSPSHPLATVGLARAVLQAVQREGVEVAVPGLPLHDTLKRIDGGGRIVATLPKPECRLVQAPMAFRAEVLRRSLATGIQDTDAQTIAERAGAVCVTVPGSPFNLHVTSSLELEMIRRLAPLADGEESGQ
jgi:2-C-methyl-D-erythritol 4-phosphate cytidylyltransferase